MGYSSRRMSILVDAIRLIGREMKMRFMMIVKASKNWEAGKTPSQELVTAMGKYNEELKKAGVLLDLAGLHASSKGARVKFAEGKRTVIDGPFAETTELIGGYWIIQVKSKQEAIEWALRAPAPHGEAEESDIEIRQVCEPEELFRNETVDYTR